MGEVRGKGEGGGDLLEIHFTNRAAMPLYSPPLLISCWEDPLIHTGAEVYYKIMQELVALAEKMQKEVPVKSRYST